MGIASEVKAKVGGVVFNKGKLPELLGKRVNKLYDEVENTLHKHANQFCQEIAAEAKEWVRNVAVPSGRQYKYVEAKTKEVLFRWTASEDGGVPVAVSHTLINALECKLYYSSGRNMTFHLGVWSHAKGGMYPTVAFYGGPELDRKGNLKKGEEEGVGRLIVGPGGTQTPVNEYAKYLEEGTDNMAPRPFLNKALKHAMEKVKATFRQTLKEALLRKMNRDKLPVYFRMYVR